MARIFVGRHYLPVQREQKDTCVGCDTASVCRASEGQPQFHGFEPHRQFPGFIPPEFI